MNREKKIFVTGASGGIGTSICDKFIDKDFSLVMTSSSDEKIFSLKKIWGWTLLL